MDLVAWAVLIAVVLAGAAMAWAIPAMLRHTRRRQAQGAGGSLAGIAGGMDAVWRPSVDEAHTDWTAAVEMPAPAPLAGDKGLDDGSITIEVPKT